VIVGLKCHLSSETAAEIERRETARIRRMKGIRVTCHRLYLAIWHERDVVHSHGNHIPPSLCFVPHFPKTQPCGMIKGQD
jgi:hypothetical protein